MLSDGISFDLPIHAVARAGAGIGREALPSTDFPGSKGSKGDALAGGQELDLALHVRHKRTECTLPADSTLGCLLNGLTNFGTAEAIIADLFAVVIVRKGGNNADAKRSRPSSLLFISDGAHGALQGRSQVDLTGQHTARFAINDVVRSLAMVASILRTRQSRRWVVRIGFA